MVMFIKREIHIRTAINFDCNVSINMLSHKIFFFDRSHPVV